MLLPASEAKVLGSQPFPTSSIPGKASQAPAVTLLGASKADLAQLAGRLQSVVELRTGPRLIVDLKASPLPLLTPLALLDAGHLAPQALLKVLNDGEIVSRPWPCLVALVDPADRLSQRLLRAAPLAVAAVAPREIAPELLGAALRVVAAPLIRGWSQLWFGGLVQPAGPLPLRGHADLRLLHTLLQSAKLSEVADSLGYTRRGVQAQVARLCERVGLRRVRGRQATSTLALQILEALR